MTQGKWSEAEGRARVDLAAAHRVAGAFGWTNIIYNHISLRVPDQPGLFLFKPHDLMFEEVTASNLLKLDLSGSVVGGTGATNPGFTTHASILAARSDVNCVMHVHTDEGMAISAQTEGLLPLSQDAMNFHKRLTYHSYGGLATGTEANDALVEDLGRSRAMIMRNHGLLTCGENAATAVVLMKYLTSCCRTQLMLQAADAPVTIPSDDVCEQTARQWDSYYAKGGLTAEWGALIRWMDRLDNGYKH